MLCFVYHFIYFCLFDLFYYFFVVQKSSMPIRDSSFITLQKITLLDLTPPPSCVFGMVKMTVTCLLTSPGQRRRQRRRRRNTSPIVVSFDLAVTWGPLIELLLLPYVIISNRRRKSPGMGGGGGGGGRRRRMTTVKRRRTGRGGIRPQDMMKNREETSIVALEWCNTSLGARRRKRRRRHIYNLIHRLKKRLGSSS